MKLIFMFCIVLLLSGCAQDTRPRHFDGTFNLVSSTCTIAANSVTIQRGYAMSDDDGFDLTAPGVASIDQNGLLTVTAPNGCITTWQRQKHKKVKGPPFLAGLQVW